MCNLKTGPFGGNLNGLRFEFFEKNNHNTLVVWQRLKPFCEHIIIIIQLFHLKDLLISIAQYELDVRA